MTTYYFISAGAQANANAGSGAGGLSPHGGGTSAGIFPTIQFFLQSIQFLWI